MGEGATPTLTGFVMPVPPAEPLEAGAEAGADAAAPPPELGSEPRRMP
jgi:hypothetical protein